MTHVLIVEDREADRKLLKMRLERNGYRVTAAGDGVEALAVARRDPPDAIVSDGLMPKMDGFALCRVWMQDAKLKTIPFIFYSATYARAEDEHFALSLGAVRYLIKPMEEEAFLRELRTVLQQWAGPAAPAPASPLNDATYYALHESALARKLKADPDMRDIHVVAVTFYPEQYPKAAALAAGCDAYLLKPINTRELSGQLTAVAEGGDAVN